MAGGRLPAPDDLRLLQEFVNSNDILAGRDALGSPAELASWLSDHRLLPAEASASDDEYRHALEIREAVRMFLSRDLGRPSDHEIKLLDDVGRQGKLRWAFEPDGSIALEAMNTGVAGALATILAPLLTAALTGTLQRLKTCRNCRWVFYDYSKNRSATWCAMRLCGSRAKAKRYYWRTRSPSTRVRRPRQQPQL
jgi:predicted RNA-binding Zn ribbon-like protein